MSTTGATMSTAGGTTWPSTGSVEIGLEGVVAGGSAGVVGVVGDTTSSMVWVTVSTGVCKTGGRATGGAGAGLVSAGGSGVAVGLV